MSACLLAIVDLAIPRSVALLVARKRDFLLFSLARQMMFYLENVTWQISKRFALVPIEERIPRVQWTLIPLRYHLACLNGFVFYTITKGQSRNFQYQTHLDVQNGGIWNISVQWNLKCRVSQYSLVEFIINISFWWGMKHAIVWYCLELIWTLKQNKFNWKK